MGSLNSRSLCSCFLGCQKPIQGIHVGFGTGNDNIHGSTASGIGDSIAFDSYQHLADGIDAFSHRVDGELSKLIGHPNYAINSLIYRIHGSGTQGGVSQGLPIRSDKPYRSRGDTVVTTRNLNMVEMIEFRGSA